MTVTFRDDAGILNRQEIQSAAGRYPFNLRVVTNSSAANRQGFEALAVREIEGQSPNTMVVAIDPVHRYVAVRYGKGLNISTDKWTLIGGAGNAEFKTGNWTTGVLKIADTARQQTNAVVIQSPVETRDPITTTTTTVVQTPPVYHHNDNSSHTGWWVLFGLVAAVAVVVYFWRRNRKKEETQQRLLTELSEEVAEKRSLNREVDDWQRRLEGSVTKRTSLSSPRSQERSEPVRSRPVYLDPPTPRYVPPPTYIAPSPVVVTQASHSDGLLTGMMLGEMMHNHHDRHVTHVIEREPEYHHQRNDSGGTVSSWESEPVRNDGGGTVASFEAPDPPSSRNTYTAPSYDAPSYDSPSYDSGSSDAGGTVSDF
jgi:hypothetical protein